MAIVLGNDLRVCRAVLWNRKCERVSGDGGSVINCLSLEILSGFLTPLFCKPAKKNASRNKLLYLYLRITLSSDDLGEDTTQLRSGGHHLAH